MTNKKLNDGRKREILLTRRKIVRLRE